MHEISIRQEDVKDYDEVFELVTKSFKTSSHSEGDEAEYLNDIRKKDTFIPELSLVAVANYKIVGQIVLYKTIIITKSEDLTELLLSPICVHPDCFGNGIARALIEESIEIASKLNFNAIFLCGNPVIYSKLGFAPTYKHNIFHVSDNERNAEWSMVREIKKGFLGNVKGTINTI